ncbi:MAG: hypothetical protein J5666_07735 [Bacilli bacterium]|nr:hypothetical protein [Bacilli bacterium]
MILMLISVLIGVYSLQFFVLNYSIQGLNRAIIFTPIEMMYKCVDAYSEKPEIIKNDFEIIVMHYYDHILPRYTKDYEVEFYYYNSSDESVCLYNECDGVEITINCKLNITYNYHRVMFYQISENNNG